MKGNRVDDPVGLMKPGEYGKINGIWHCKAPRETEDGLGYMGNLSAHAVTEHEDGTITVSPSILITRHDGSWHGFLECGIWREC